MLLTFLISGIKHAAAQTRTPLSNSTALYARVIRLSHNVDPSKNGGLVTTVVAFPEGVGEIDVYGSEDGASFTQIGAIHDSDFSGGLCCGTLFELSSAVGSMPAGTLLWAGSVGQTSTTQPMQLKVYESADRGVTWSYLSNCATAPGVHSAVGGLWEPQFEIASDGAMVCFWSDETETGHSQVIRQIRSYDGINWKDETDTVASSVSSDRPGMPVVTLLPNGLYFMSYEICGTPACAAYTRTSTDGWNWGAATNLGTKVLTASGQWLEHAPFNAWAPSAASANGTLLLVGQMMYDSNGTVSAGNGVTILTSHSADGSGTWGTMPAPVKVPTAYNNYCPNYSSPLLPSVDGSTVLEFASDYVGSVCTMFYGTGPIIAGTVAPVVTVSSATSTLASYPLQVTVTVAGTGSLPVPTGNVTLTSGSFTATQALVNGATTFSISGPLAAGTDTLTASYVGDSNYTSATGSTSVSVPAPSISVSSSPLTLKAGATSSNTVTISVTPAGGFSGTVRLSASILSGPEGGTVPPSFSFSPSNVVTISGSSASTATLEVKTTAATSAQLSAPRPPLHHGFPEAPISCSGIFLFAMFGKVRSFREKLRNGVWMIVIFGVVSGCITGCGGSKSSTNVQGTTLGTYEVQVVAISNSVTATGQFELTVQ